MKSKCEKIKELATMGPEEISAHITGRFVPESKSKCEKAAEKIANSLGAQGAWEESLAKQAAIKGAEALLRYAKRNQHHSGVYGSYAVDIPVLEEWVKGEKWKKKSR